MSVLVEALSVIVRRVTLDIAYPGGAEQYLVDAIASDCPSRLACADDQLTAVSFLSPKDCTAWVAELERIGLIHVDDNRAIDIVCIDQRCGPTMPCDWIEWRQHSDGFTYCWPAGQEPGDMAAPVEWGPEQSRRLLRRDMRDEAHMWPLAVEDGIEYWLDLTTGQQVVGLPQRPEEQEMPVRKPKQPPSERPLMALIHATLENLEWIAESVTEGVVRVQISSARFVFSLMIGISERDRTIVCFGFFPALVDANRRLAVAEAMSRMNHGFIIGSLDLDFDDGEMRYRIGCDVEHCEPTEQMVVSMIRTLCASMDRCGPALLNVAFGAASPADAARQVLENVEND